VLLNNLAMVQRAMGSRGEAEATLRRAVKADPALAFPHKNLGLLLLGSEAFRDEALRELQEAARLDPDDAEMQGALAALYAERGDRAEAIAAYTKARRLDPNDPRPARLALQYTFLAEDPEASTSPRARP
jgi:Flp pilus assembly protein TadD